MRFPSSSSLLLASLASSSSLSALAAPMGDCPDDSSSTASAPLNHGDTAIQSNNNLQSRGVVDSLPPPLNEVLGGIIKVLHSDKDPKARADPPLPLGDVVKTVEGLARGGAGRRAARAEESGETDSPEDSSPPAAADPDGSAQSPATPAAPSPPGLPVKLPVSSPLPGDMKLPVGRRDASGLAGLLSPPPPRNPPNTPVQRELSFI